MEHRPCVGLECLKFPIEIDCYLPYVNRPVPENERGKRGWLTSRVLPMQFHVIEAAVGERVEYDLVVSRWRRNANGNHGPGCRLKDHCGSPVIEIPIAHDQIPGLNRARYFDCSPYFR
jgi:hypothetical protein